MLIVSMGTGRGRGQRSLSCIEHSRCAICDCWYMKMYEYDNGSVVYSVDRARCTRTLRVRVIYMGQWVT